MFVDNPHVVEWVRWVFKQPHGVKVTGMSELVRITTPPPGHDAIDLTVVDRREPEIAWLESDKLRWAVLAYVAIVAIGSLVRIISLIA